MVKTVKLDQKEIEALIDGIWRELIEANPLEITPRELRTLATLVEAWNLSDVLAADP